MASETLRQLQDAFFARNGGLISRKRCIRKNVKANVHAVRLPPPLAIRVEDWREERTSRIGVTMTISEALLELVEMGLPRIPR